MCLTYVPIITETVQYNIGFKVSYERELKYFYYRADIDFVISKDFPSSFY